MAIAICSTIFTSLGGFSHLESIPPENLGLVLKVMWATQPFGIMGLAPGKASVGVTLLRIRGKTASASFRWLVYALITLTLTIAIPTVFLQYFQCTPPQALWTPRIQGKCLDPYIQADYAIFYGAWGAFTDFCFALLPLTFILSLNLSLSRRIGLCILLGLGILTGAIAIVRTTALRELGARSDITWNIYDLFVWQGSEMFLVVVLGSAPTLKPLFDRYFTKEPKFTSSSVQTLTAPTNKSYKRQRSSASDTSPRLLYVEGNGEAHNLMKLHQPSELPTEIGYARSTNGNHLQHVERGIDDNRL
ncbi:MAG: hypothetical protein M1820_010187 [Bogoriella megaspora]|nr:MAG: hypothetical protein M1820_010187 [Bogoriella megaspora]